MAGKKTKKAVCLFSGGLDSTTVLYYAIDQGYEPYCLTFDYGQRHKKEIQAAKRIAKRLRVPQQIMKIQLPWGGNALTDMSIDVPQKKRLTKTTHIPSTYVPSRNLIFLSFAQSWAEVIGAEAICIGVNQLDYSGYPDCRAEFIRAFQKAVRVGTKSGVEDRHTKIITPLINLSKKEIAQMAHALGVPVSDTWSCYSGGTDPCGTCEACLLRARGFKQACLKEWA